MIVQQIKNNSYIDLSKLDVSAQNAGYQIVDVLTGNFYVLMPSTATVDHVNVESVMGQAVMRWLKTGQNTSGGVEGTVHVTLPILGDGSISTPLALGTINAQTNTFYAKPTGDDTKDGLSWDTAKQTFLAAYNAMYASGGGTVYVAHNTQGPIWIRGDGVPVPGFVQATRCRIVGTGLVSNEQFGVPAASDILGGVGFGGGRFTPSIWITATGGVPISIENIKTGELSNQPVRLGWDYYRKADYTPKTQTIASWARTTSVLPGTSVITVTLPSYNITSMSRTGTTVTVNFTNTDTHASWTVQPANGTGSTDSVLRIAGTSGSFTAGDYPITGVLSNGSLTYTQGSGTASAGAGGTLSCHGVNFQDRLEVVSTSTEVPSTVYRVQSTTVTTVTVTDWYGYSPRTPTITVSSPGTFVLQNRSINTAIGLVDLINVQGNMTVTEAGLDRFETGPCVDMGGTSDGRIRLINTSFCGGFGATSGADIHDPDRSAWMLMDASSRWASGLVVRHARPSAGGIRVYGGQTYSWSLEIDDVVADISVPDIAPPLIEVTGPSNYDAGSIRATRSFNTDKANNVSPDFITTGMKANNAYIDTGIVQGPGLIIQSTTAAAWGGDITSSPLDQGQAGFWADTRIAGRHPGNYRALGGLATCRYPNLINPNTGTWTLSGASIATGTKDPFGNTDAMTITRSGSGFLIVNTSDTSTRALGDRWAIGCWAQGPAGTGLVSPGAFGIIEYQQIPNNGNLLAGCEVAFLGDGEWQWYSAGCTITTLTNTTAPSQLTLGIAASCNFYGLVLIKVPANDMTDNEFAEYVLTMRHQPYYITPGLTGTFEKRKMIAHGGMGIDTSVPKVAGVASGQLTVGAITTYEPRYAADGVTVIGWSPLFAATINP